MTRTEEPDMTCTYWDDGFGNDSSHLWNRLTPTLVLYFLNGWATMLSDDWRYGAADPIDNPY